MHKVKQLMLALSLFVGLMTPQVLADTSAC